MVPALALLVSLAMAAPADDLAALDGHVARLEATTLPARPQELTAALQAAVAEYGALQQRAVTASRGAEPAQVAQVSLRLGRGGLALVEAMLEAPCPDPLTPDQCAIYAGAIAEKASVLLHPAEDALSRARGLAPHLGAAGRQALRRSEARLARLSERADAALPPPRPRPTGDPGAAPQREVVGGGGAAPAGWTPDPGSGGPWVLVDKTAWLTAARDGSGARARARTQAPAGGQPERTLARLVRAEGDRVLLELGAGDHRQHCHFDPPWTGPARLLMWADRGALGRVTTRPIDRRFDDGTGVALRPGALVPDGGAVWADGLLLPLDLPVDAVGDRYEVEPAPGAASQGDRAWIDGREAWTLGGRRLDRAPQIRSSTGLRSVEVAATAGPDDLLTFRSACGVVTLAASGRDPDLDASGLSGVLGGLVDDEARVVFPADAPLLWADGTPAGQLVAEAVHPADAVTARPGGLRCVDQVLDRWQGEDHPARHLTVCVQEP